MFFSLLEQFFFHRSIPSFGISCSLAVAVWFISYIFLNKEGPGQIFTLIKIYIDPEQLITPGTLKYVITCAICQAPYIALLLTAISHIAWWWAIVLAGKAALIHLLMEYVDATLTTHPPDEEFEPSGTESQG